MEMTGGWIRGEFMSRTKQTRKDSRKGRGGIAKNESGEVMLESTIILFSVLILVMAMLSLCFLYYQEAMMESIAEEIAADVARNFKYAGETRPIGSNTVTLDDLKAEPMYRMTFGFSKIANKHKDRVNAYLPRRLSITSLGFHSKAPEADCVVRLSSIGRAYVTVRVEQKTDFFLSGVLKYLDIWNDGDTFGATATAECVDISGYTSSVNFLEFLCNGPLKDAEGIARIYDDVVAIIRIIKG